MSDIVVKRGQSILDIAILYCGDVSACFEVASLNGISLSDSLKTGQKLVVPQSVNKNVVAIFNGNKQPATGITDTNLLAQAKRGIGFMKITDGTQESNGFISS